MCKLFCVIDIENQNNVEKFIRQAVPYVTKTDNHGLGIMRLGENGVHIQRWLDIPKRLKTSLSVKSPYLKAMRIESNEFGKKSNTLNAIAIHGRFATCGISLENTHPFYLEGSALIHNGVLSNVKPEDQVLSSCDSEVLLHRYVNNKIKDKPDNLTVALNDVVGYYAVIVFNDNGIVDIFRDETATLFIAHVRNIGTVIATTAELIYRTATKTKHRVDYCYPILAFSHIRWQKGIEPKVFTFDKPYVNEIQKTENIDSLYQEIVDYRSDKDKWWNSEYEQSSKLKVGI